MSAAPFLKCGCQAHAHRGGQPSCIIHGCVEQAPVPALEGRISKCSCGQERPSTDALEGKLAFFEFRGPGATDDRCRACNYYEIAHREVPGRRGKAITDHAFAPRTEGYPNDLHYCGCRGWD